MRSVEYSKYCMECSGSKENGQETIIMAECDDKNKRQQWIFRSYTQLYDDVKDGKLTESDYLKKIL